MPTHPPFWCTCCKGFRQEKMQNLSSYADDLKPEAKYRYLCKISIIGGVDPSVKLVVGENADRVPPVEACDLVSYLVLKTSFITSAQFKACKGLEVYNQFVSGWIKEVNTRKICCKYLTMGCVSLSANRYYELLVCSQTKYMSLSGVY